MKFDNAIEHEVHIVLAGGGTAGHVNPLLSVANAIKSSILKR